MSSTPTDLSELRLPIECHEDLARPRRHVLEQPVTVDARWWNAALAEFHLPGGPLAGADSGSVATTISRGQLFEIAAVDDDVQALRLLWHTLAWGSGNKLRHNRRRMAAVATDPAETARLLRLAASLAGHDPAGAYRVLFPQDQRTAIGHLGPAFFTKYLYVAGRGQSEHLAMILDSRVATSLNVLCGWTSLRPEGRWPAWTYERYCRLLRRWADEHRVQHGNPINPDQIEHSLFTHTPRRRLHEPRHPSSSPDPATTDRGRGNSHELSGGGAHALSETLEP